MGFQFVHMENFSRKGDKNGRSVSFVLAEARRDPAASLHVSSPRTPEVIFGATINEVERLHDDTAGSARAIRNGPSGTSTKAIQKTQHTIATVIMSHPYTVSEVETDPAKRAEVEKWEGLNVAWLRRGFGDNLVSVIRHTDEKQWHLHAYMLPGSPDMRASLLHPGQVAKAAVLSAGPAENEDEKTLIKRSDRAYKEAMRAWQDSYSRDVGMPAGLTRLGPATRRLTRSEWHNEQRQAEALKVARARAAHLKEQGEAFLSRTKKHAAAERAAVALQQAAAQAAVAEALKVRAEADARSANALVQQDLALKQKEEALRASERARRDIRLAQRFSGLGGSLRAMWDGLRRSLIAERILGELQATVEAWRDFAAAADGRAAAADIARREAEEKSKLLRRAAAELGAQRDGLRRRLALYEPDAPDPVVTPRRR